MRRPTSIINDGPHVTEALRFIERNITEPQLEKIRHKASEILDYSISKADRENDGLLYGLIQSGKTSIVTITAAMAVDSGVE